MKTILLLGLLGALALLQSGCVVALGNKDTGFPNAHRATTGQELLDLKKARDSGAMSEEEYQLQRKRVLEGRRP